MSDFFQNKVTPDFDGLRKCILRKQEPERVFFFEFYLDDLIKEEIVKRFDLLRGVARDHPFYFYQKEIILQKFLGYDMALYNLAMEFPSELNLTGKRNTAETSSDMASTGPIKTREDLESYPWPKVADVDWSALDWLEKELPENMKCYVNCPIGLYKMLLGYEDMLYLMYDNPLLMKAVVEKVTDIFLDYARVACQYSCVGAVMGADDMGFRTQTFFPPDFIRANILPSHKSLAQLAHDCGKMYFLHACGNLEEIMDDLIEVVKIDAKHSFEDAIVPVTEMKKKYGDRVALLGGIDIDFLCRSDESTIRKHVRKTLEICHQGGGYCLGSGNSIADYVPVENYLIMLDEGRNFKR